MCLDFLACVFFGLGVSNVIRLGDGLSVDSGYGSDVEVLSEVLLEISCFETIKLILDGHFRGCTHIWGRGCQKGPPSLKSATHIPQ